MTGEMFLICLFVFITGACIGSFLNVAALRAISKESVVFPSSKCPICSEPIKWFDNIPIFSYFFTIRGKCRNCGGKVSIQYPLIETLSAILFLAVFLCFGFSIKTVLILILLSIALTITITDFKRNEVYDIHAWLLISAAIITSLYINGVGNYSETLIGFLSGAVIMELIARLSYYLVRKNDTAQEETAAAEDNAIEKNNNIENNEETFDINEYIKKNKRAFGEGDTLLASAAGALLGWKYFIAAAAFAVILQAVCILPQFIAGLYKQKKFTLLVSLSVFVALAFLYWGLSSVFSLHPFVVFGFIILLLFFGADTIIRLKNTANEHGFSAIPFGPALLFSMFLIFFFGDEIINFVKHYIFMIAM